MARVTALSVNGKKMTVDVDSTVSLLSVLRNDLNLTGSKGSRAVYQRVDQHHRKQPRAA